MTNQEKENLKNLYIGKQVYKIHISFDNPYLIISLFISSLTYRSNNQIGICLKKDLQSRDAGETYIYYVNNVNNNIFLNEEEAKFKILQLKNDELQKLLKDKSIIENKLDIIRNSINQSNCE